MSVCVAKRLPCGWLLPTRLITYVLLVFFVVCIFYYAIIIVGLTSLFIWTRNENMYIQNVRNIYSVFSSFRPPSYICVCVYAIVRDVRVCIVNRKGLQLKCLMMHIERDHWIQSHTKLDLLRCDAFSNTRRTLSSLLLYFSFFTFIPENGEFFFLCGRRHRSFSLYIYIHRHLGRVHACNATMSFCSSQFHSTRTCYTWIVIITYEWYFMSDHVFEVLSSVRHRPCHHRHYSHEKSEQFLSAKERKRKKKHEIIGLNYKKIDYIMLSSSSSSQPSPLCTRLR